MPSWCGAVTSPTGPGRHEQDRNPQPLGRPQRNAASVRAASVRAACLLMPQAPVSMHPSIRGHPCKARCACPPACLQALGRAGFGAWAAPVEVQGDTANAVLCAMQQAAVNVGAGDEDAQAAALELVEWLLAQGGLPDTHVHTGAFQHLCFGEGAWGGGGRGGGGGGGRPLVAMMAVAMMRTISYACMYMCMVWAADNRLIRSH